MSREDFASRTDLSKEPAPSPLPYYPSVRPSYALAAGPPPPLQLLFGRARLWAGQAGREAGRSVQQGRVEAEQLYR